MIFSPRDVVKKKGSFCFCGTVEAFGNSCLKEPVISEFWKGFTFQSSDLQIEETKEYTFSIGKAQRPATDGCAYAINIEKDGVCIAAENKRDLLQGFMTLLDRMHPAEDGVLLDCCLIKDTPCVSNRMVHFCVFPETELWELQRFIRLCGALKYTHIVLEFWGMLRYDYMQELSWQHGYTKEQVRPLIAEANALGMEVIPMFNHWGHASASRVRYGKHVVLDQNPRLQTWFSEDGWCWAIEKPKVRKLLHQIREELIELCGSGSYFHIGCDEAYNFDLSRTESMDTICDYINEVARELREQGRETIIWGDMFLYRYPHYNAKNHYYCNAPSPECEQYMLDRLSKDIIIADWQYHAAEAPVETASVFKKAGFRCLICPWDRSVSKLTSCLQTAKDESLMGILHTTWHTLTRGMPFVTMAAGGSFDGSLCIKENAAYKTATAALLRKVFPANGDSRKAGWSKEQLGDMD